MASKLLCCALLLSARVASADVLSEGIILPSTEVAAVSVDVGRCYNLRKQRFDTCAHYAGPDAIRQYGVPSGPSRWAFWTALAAQGATVATQEYAYARFGVYGAHVGTRMRSAAFNLGPVLAVKAFGRFFRRPDADASIIPSIGWGVWGTVRNVRDIRKIDALLKETK